MYADVIVDISHEKLDKTFQYAVPKQLEQEISEGMRVKVPFGNRKITGYVVGLTDVAEYDVAKIKPVFSIMKESAVIESQLIALAAWIRKNYGGTMNQALKTVLPVKHKEKQKEKKQVRLLISQEEAASMHAECDRRHYTAQAKLLAELMECSPQSYAHLTKELGIPSSAVRNFEEKGMIKIEREFYYRNPVSNITTKQYEIQLNEDQKKLAEAIMMESDAGRAHTYLLHGVTGSGKTEVYMELIAHAAQKGMQSIMLIPEIALTFQTVRRFYERFGDRVSILHSRLSSGERWDQLERAKNGEIDIMIGPRSALFTPFSNLGFIIIDEEHENSYKSETVPKYHARDVAITRAQMAGASVVLGSATPSVDSYYRALSGEYQLLVMERRVRDQKLPVCEIADLRAEMRAGNRSILSRRLQELIEDRLAKKQQVMLFLNRRGLAGFVSCRACGSVLRCPHCDVSLSQHKHGRLICHYCGYEMPMVDKCPSCGSSYIGAFKAGTQKIQELTAQRFPQAKILRMDYDTTRSKDSYEQILSAFSRQEADILIGTQMIVKGHDFAKVTLVGILAADMSLHAGDYRAGERTFQLLTQAAGRAGRSTLAGEVVIQTYQPEHYTIIHAANQDYKGFYEEEIAYRDLMMYPPAAHMMAVLILSEDELEGEEHAKELSDRAVSRFAENRPTIIGPSAAAVGKINDVYRNVFYIKHREYQVLVDIKDNLEQFIEQAQWSRCSIQFDFNPINTY